MSPKETTDMCVTIEQVTREIENRAKLTEVEMRSAFDLVNEKLDRIQEAGEKTLEQATKTNGRVNIMEKDIRDLQEHERSHGITCPNLPAIRALQDKQLTNTVIVNTLWKIAGALGALITLLTGTLAFLGGYI